MKAHITYTADGTITSLAIGDGPLEAERVSPQRWTCRTTSQVSGENAEAKVAKAVARLVVKPGTGTLEARP